MILESADEKPRITIRYNPRIMMALALLFVPMLLGIVDGNSVDKNFNLPAKSLSTSGIDCAPSSDRLYVLVGGFFNKGHVNVYCGDKTRPVATFYPAGAKGILGGITIDRFGQIYMTDTTESEGTNLRGALIAYDKQGRFLARIDGLENNSQPFVDKNSGVVYAVTPHYEDYSPAQWKNETGWIPHLTVIGGNPPVVMGRLSPPENVAARFYLIDDPGCIYLWDNNNGDVDKMSVKTGKILKSVFAPAGAMTLGPNHTIYANGNGTIRLIETRALKVVRTFHDGSKSPWDDGPIAVAEDGTLYVAHKLSARIERFAPGGSKAAAVIRNVGNVRGLEVGNDGTLFVAVGGAGSGPPSMSAGVYAYAPKQSQPLRMYTDAEGRTLGVVDSWTLVRGRSQQR